MSEPVWTTKEGRTIPIREMDERHLVKAAVMLECHKEELWASLGGFGVYLYKDANDFLTRGTPYLDLLAELDRRKLVRETERMTRLVKWLEDLSAAVQAASTALSRSFRL